MAAKIVFEEEMLKLMLNFENETKLEFTYYIKLMPATYEMIEFSLTTPEALLLDKYASKILMAIIEKPKSAPQLSRNLGIPLVTCYRRIRALEAQRMLKSESRRVGIWKNKIKFYQSTFRTAQITYKNGELSTTLN